MGNYAEEKQDPIDAFVKAYECFKYGKGIEKAIKIPNLPDAYDTPYCLPVEIHDAKERNFTMQLSMYVSGKDFVLLFQLLEGPRLAYNKLRGGFEDILLANFFYNETGEEQEEKTSEKPVAQKIAPTENEEKTTEAVASG